MIKRLTKSKKSKKGAILVIVVLILALAMIFIASAMMLTQATRRRLYSTAMQSQARLTVTAASEVFLEALKMQEITDTQLESIMGKTHGAGKQKVKMVVDGVPGMSTSADNCTYLDIYPDPTDASYVYCDFTTIIGDTTENVQVVLKADSSDPVFGSQFKNQVEVAGGVGIGELRFTNGCGIWDKNKISRPTDNNVVLRGSYWGQTSSSLYFSDVVLGQSATNINFGGGEEFYGRMIFLQGAQMNGRSSAKIYGDIYLIGNDNSAGLALKDPGQPGLWDDLKNQNFVFSGRSVQNDTGDSNHKVRDAVKHSTNKCYFVDANGNSLGSSHNNMKGYSQSGDSYTVTNAAQSSTLSGLAANVKRYQGWNYSNTSNPFPSAASVFSKLCPDGDVATSNGTVILTYDTYSPTGEFFQHGTTIPDGKKYIVHPVTTTYPSYKKDADGKPEKYLYLNAINSSQALDPGYYYITSTDETATSVNGGGEAYRYDPIVLAIDGSRGDEYRFYFAGGKKFMIRGIVFAIYNADSTKPVLFIMESGAKIQLSHNNDGLGDDQSNLCSAGFLSVSTRTGCNSAANTITYVKTKNWASEAKAVSNSDYKDHNGNTPTVKYSKYHDGIVRPAMFIYGVGNNVFVLGKSVTVEAYIGLYGNSQFGPIDGSGNHQQLYGRIECEAFHTFSQNGDFNQGGDNPVGDFSLPYCPQPASSSNIPKQRLAVSKYSVADVIYYYDSGTTSGS